MVEEMRAAIKVLSRNKKGFVLPVSIGAEERLLAAALCAVGLVIATLPALLCLRRPITRGLKS